MVCAFLVVVPADREIEHDLGRVDNMKPLRSHRVQERGVDDGHDTKEEGNLMIQVFSSRAVGHTENDTDLLLRPHYFCGLPGGVESTHPGGDLDLKLLHLLLDILGVFAVARRRLDAFEALIRPNLELLAMFLEIPFQQVQSGVEVGFESVCGCRIWQGSAK